MCGIVGYVGCHRPELIEPMCDRIVHRGPDGSGAWFSERERVGLGHRRLSIIDLSEAGRQPMSNADESVWITYNGEIYNFPEHRERLAAAGYPFRSKTDTEVLLALYDECGLDFLNQLNGIFGFGLWDSRRQRLILARDHAGTKPLYYWQRGESLFFASEIKSLLAIPELSREIHAPSLASYLTFLWVPGPDTLLADVKKVEPGECLIWERGRIRTHRWFELDYTPDEAPDESEWVERVHDTFMSTTRRQMVSDVPLGAFLSGGLDSSSIVACMRESFPARKIQTYTIHFEDGDIAAEQGADDYPYAQRVAEALDVDLECIRLKPDVIGLLPKMVYHLDEPDADPAGILSYLIASAARRDGIKVLLSGTGGDEIFFGYRSYLAYRQYERLAWAARAPFSQLIQMAASFGATALGAQHVLPRRIRKFHRGLTQRGLARHMAIADWSSPETRERIFSPAFRREIDPGAIPECMQGYVDSFRGQGELNLRSHLLIQTFLAAHNFLYTDKATMATSVETRVPFMDVELMRLCAQIPERLQLRNGVTKSILKKAMERHLPKDVIYRTKAGFGSPLRKWVKDDLGEVIRELLGPETVERRGIFAPNVIQSIIQENATGKQDHTYLIYALLSLELWQQSFIDQPGIEVTL